MAHRNLKSRAVARIVTVLVILVLLNVVSIRLFNRIDVTEKQIFSLSPASKELVHSLDDKLTVRAFFTDNLPAPHNNNRRMVLDELNEYKAYSNGNFQYEFLDPSGEKGEQEAQQQGIPPVQLQVLKSDKFEVMRAYMGLVFLYEDKKEILPVVQNIGSLEYDISSTIKRLTSKSRKKIGFLTGHGETPLSEATRVQQLLSKQYDVTSVDVSKGKVVPADVNVLIVMAPTSSFPETDKFQIDQFVMRGGKVAFLLNRVDANLQNRFGREVTLNLDDQLRAYGLVIHPDLVRDLQCANISVMQQQFGFQIQSQVPFPLLPLVSNVNKENSMVKDLEGVMFFFISSVDTVNLGGRNLSGQVLLSSSKQSGRQNSPFFFDPLQKYTQEDLATTFSEHNIPVAAVTSGQYKSAFEGKPVPVDTAADAIHFAGTPLLVSPETRVVLVGDGDFVRDQYLGNRDNLTLFANMMDYLADDAGLISIRTKDVSLPPLEQVSDETRNMLKYGNLILPPALVLGYGLFRWRVRKARKKGME